MSWYCVNCGIALNLFIQNWRESWKYFYCGFYSQEVDIVLCWSIYKFHSPRRKTLKPSQMFCSIYRNGRDTERLFSVLLPCPHYTRRGMHSHTSLPSICSDIYVSDASSRSIQVLSSAQPMPGIAGIPVWPVPVDRSSGAMHHEGPEVVGSRYIQGPPSDRALHAQVYPRGISRQCPLLLYLPPTRPASQTRPHIPPGTPQNTCTLHATHVPSSQRLLPRTQRRNLKSLWCLLYCLLSRPLVSFEYFYILADKSIFNVLYRFGVGCYIVVQE